jgi:hypothetical protein
VTTIGGGSICKIILTSVPMHQRRTDAVRHRKDFQ